MARPYAVDVFAGAGLMGLGFNVEGFNVGEMCEWDQGAVETLRYNYPHDDVVRCNADVWSPKVPKGGIDLMFGGPPCQGFSPAGKGLGRLNPRHKFHLTLKWAKAHRPRYMVWENSGILGAKHKEWRDGWWKKMRRLGYDGVIWNLLAADYGTPQARWRVFFVLWQKGDDRAAERLSQPPPQTYARPDLADELGLPPWTSGHSRLHAGCCGRYGLYTCRFLNNELDMCSRCIQGDHWVAADNEEWGEELPKETLEYILRDPERITKKHIPADFTGTLPARAKIGHLAPAMTASMQKGASYSLVIEPGAEVPSIEGLHEMAVRQLKHGTPGVRRLSIREAAKLQDCPQGYTFRGSRTSQWRQVGNAVPVNLARAVARHVLYGMGRRPPRGAFAFDPYSGLWPINEDDQRCWPAYRNLMRLQGHEVGQMELVPLSRLRRR